MPLNALRFHIGACTLSLILGAALIGCSDNSGEFKQEIINKKPQNSVEIERLSEWVKATDMRLKDLSCGIDTAARNAGLTAIRNASLAEGRLDAINQITKLQEFSALKQACESPIGRLFASAGLPACRTVNEAFSIKLEPSPTQVVGYTLLWGGTLLAILTPLLILCRRLFDFAAQLAGLPSMHELHELREIDQRLSERTGQLRLAQSEAQEAIHKKALALREASIALDNLEARRNDLAKIEQRIENMRKMLSSKMAEIKNINDLDELARIASSLKSN